MSKSINVGEDSFLDIVANLVGILIILLVIVGANASQQLEQSTPDQEQATKIDALTDQLTRDQLAAEKIYQDNQQMEREIQQQNQLAASLTDRRHRMLVQLELIKQETERQRERLEDRLAEVEQDKREQLTQQVSFDQQRNQLEAQLKSVQQATYAVEANNESGAAAPETIDHYPSPIARTVFAEEVHFQLRDGRLAYVPMDELIALMKREWKLKAEKLAEANGTLETVGPVAGYRMQYQLAAQNVPQQTQVGIVERREVQFDRFIVLPQPGLQGETVEQALQAGSQFLQRLEGRQPARTTVSIWLYPDGFAEHGKIKTWLHEQGFRMASWPLVEGRPISGGPNGFKTSAQ